MISRRSAIFAAILLICTFALFHSPVHLPRTSLDSSSSIPLEDAKSHENDGHEAVMTTTSAVSAALITPATQDLQSESTLKDTSGPSILPQVQNYFDQVFSISKPPEYDFPALRQQCSQRQWPEDDVYLRCVGMAAGLTSIMSQVKVCLKMAIETGTHIVLPSMPLRDSTDLTEFNFFNEEAHLVYDKWFDADHLIESMKRACPQMKIIHPNLLDFMVPVKNRWTMRIGVAPNFQPFQSYFWAGRPFKPFFEEQYARLEEMAFLAPDRNDSKTGITVITVDSQFVLFRITDDPTGQDLKLWNDLSLLIRFRDEPRLIIHQLLMQLHRPFYGVHFRVEKDSIWSSLEAQLSVDLDALDRAWAKYGVPGAQKPLVYLACGDQEQVEKFVLAGLERGWEVTHKWHLAQGNAETLKMINDLAFDFQGAVDMGIIIQSEFFLGIIGSAFSSTIANARDTTGKYRGSSFLVFDDGGARTHLFNDGDSNVYACCL